MISDHTVRVFGPQPREVFSDLPAGGFGRDVDLSLHCAREAGTLVSMEVTLPKPLDERLSPKDTALHLAIGLFVTEEATLGQAAQTAGLSQGEFLRELGRRRIPIHYGQEELHADLETIESLVPR